MPEPQAPPKAAAITCTCGHPGSEHSACSGECYLCACKHYTPVGTAPEHAPRLARVYRQIIGRIRPAAR